MASLKPSTRYTWCDTLSSTSSHFSDPSSSSEFKLKSTVSSQSSSSRALVNSKPSDLAKTKAKPSNQNLTAMMKKFMEKRSSSKPMSGTQMGLVIPADFIAEDLKKTARKGTNFGGFHKKLFGKGNGSVDKKDKEGREVKALTEVKGNTRTLAMVLRSERELLSLNKQQEIEITELKLMVEEKNREVEKLKDLFLKQREEIKSLKNAILFPDVMNSQLHELLEKQGSELKQANQVIPTLQMQVTSLTGQLQCLAEDLAEVKAGKHSTRSWLQHNGSSPRTPVYDHEDPSNSLDFSSCNPTSPGSPDDMFIKDLNPCLTPYSKTKSNEFDAMGYELPRDESFSRNNMENGSYVRRLSKSSDCYRNSNATNISRPARRSDEAKCTYGKQRHHQKLY